jgi:transposase
MATKQQFKQSSADRQRRTFSEEFKRKKVKEIEQKITTITAVCKEYEVRDSNVRKWLATFGTNYMKGVRIIVESESDTMKIIELKKQVAELERLVGQKQVVLEFKDKMIELAEEHYGVDIKKKFGTTPSSGTGTIEKRLDVV